MKRFILTVAYNYKSIPIIIVNGKSTNLQEGEVISFTLYFPLLMCILKYIL